MKRLKKLVKNISFEEPLITDGFFISGVLPPIYIIAVLYADYVTPFGTITPFWFEVAILLMALYLKPSKMIPWSILYTLIICSIFLSPKLHQAFSGRAISDMSAQYFRAGTYVIVCVMSCVFCVTLQRLRQLRKENSELLQQLPWPVITSDDNGRIIFANQAAVKLVPELANPDGSRNYFDLLAPKETQGKVIASYLSRIGKTSVSPPLDLFVLGKPAKGYTKHIAGTGKAVLLTTLST